MLGSPAVLQALRDTDELRRGFDLLVEPLAAVLAAGAADGSFPAAAPASDPAAINAIAWDAAHAMSEVPPGRRDAIAAAAMDFVLRALGAPPAQG